MALRRAAVAVPKLVRKRLPDTPMTLSGAGSATVDALVAGADGGSSGLLVWPGGFPEIGAAAATAALAAQASGAASFRVMTFPWRPGAAATASTLMTDEADVVANALARVNARAAAGARTRSPVAAAREAHDILALRLRSLDRSDTARRSKGGKTLPPELRHPSLDELFPTFAPPETPHGVHVLAGAGFMSRIRGYTDLGAMLGRDDFEAYASQVEDPRFSPFAMLGMPGGSRQAWLAAMDAAGEPPDVLLLDLGEAGRKALGTRTWRSQAELFVEDARARWPDVGVAVITDSPSVAKEVGSPDKGVPMVARMDMVLGGATSLTAPFDASAAAQRTRWFVEPKDRSLERVVWDSKNLMSDFYRWGNGSGGGYAIDAVQLRMIRMANAPCGWGATRTLLQRDNPDGIPDILERRYFPMGYLRTVLEAARAEETKGRPENAARVREVVSVVHKAAEKLRDITPIMGNLRRRLPALASIKGARIALAFRSPDMCELFDECFLPTLPPADRERVRRAVTAVSRTDLRAALATGEARKWSALVMVAPEQEDVGYVMAAAHPPRQALVLSDAFSARNLARHLRQTGRIARRTDWGAEVATLVDALEQGCEDLPDLDALFGNPDHDEQTARQAAVADGGWDVTFAIEDGDEIGCGSATPVLVHSDELGTSFRRVRASDVQEGDVILVPSEDMPPTLMDVLRGLERDDAERRGVLRDYHVDVLRRAAAVPWSHMGVPRTILARMQRALPELEPSELQNVTRWLAVRPGQETPNAPGDRIRFGAFAAALGMAPDDADRYWVDAIVPWRDLRKENGQQSYNRAFGFLADPDSAAVHLGLSPEAHDALMAETYSRMRRVVAVVHAPVPGAAEPEEAPAPAM